MKLFQITEDKTIALNKEWIFLIPEFAVILKRDKGSKGDTQARYKLQAIREFTYIYFMCDFNSPLRDWKTEEKEKEALYYADLEKKDIDDKIIAAIEKYRQLMIGVSRSLRTLKSVYKGLDEMDNYFEKVSFEKYDKMGRQLNTPQDFIKNTSLMNKMYDELRKFEKRVEEDMAENGATIRGNATLGDKEGQKASWSEEDIAKGSTHTHEGETSTGSFGDMLKILQEQAKAEKDQERAAELTKPSKLVTIGDALDEEEDSE